MVMYICLFDASWILRRFPRLLIIYFHYSCEKDISLHIYYSTIIMHLGQE